MADRNGTGTLEPKPRRPGPRTGTSIAEFEATFPDDTACEQHLLVVRYGHLTRCPWCGLNTSWWKHPKRSYYVCTRCRRLLQLKSQTMFHKTQLSLKTLFYGVLLSANLTATPPNLALQRHLGMSNSAAIAFGRRLRAHLTALENQRRIGGNGGDVHVEIFYFKGLYSVKSKGKKRVPVVVLSDGFESTVSVLDTTRPARIFEVLRKRVLLGCQITANDPGLFEKLSRYRQNWFSVVDMSRQDALFIESYQYETKAFIVNAVTAIRNTYRRVSIEWLDQYLGEQIFRFNHRGSSVFNHMIAKFPRLDANILMSRNRVKAEHD